MAHRVAHLIPVIRYSQKFLTYVIPVIRCVALSNTSNSIHEVWSEAADIRHYVWNKVCYIE